MGMNALEVRRRVMLAQPHEAVASGAVASFRTDVLSPLPLEFDLEPIQSGTGDPSPDNIRPITGHDGFTRTGTGKNLLDIDALITAPSGEIGSYEFKHVYVLKLEPNTVYTLSTSYSGTRNVLYFNGASSSDAVRSGSPVTKTSSATGELIIGLYDRTGIGQFENKTVTVQLEKGESVTSYQEFGHSYTTEFPTPPGTVYGGHVKDNGDGTGTLVVKRSDLIDLGGLTWNKYNGVFYATINDIAHGSNEYYVISDSYESAVAVNGTGASGSWGDCTIRGNNSTDKYIYIKDTAQTNLTKEQFKEYVTGKKAVYLLAEPVQYTLSLTALQSLIGQNHVWVDNADEVSVEYWGH